MRILLVGDVVGKPGQRMVYRALRELKRRHKVSLAIVNAENAADGSGITPGIYEKMVNAGADAITLGDHIYRRKEIAHVLERESNIVKPANFPAEAPGHPWAVVTADNGIQVAVVSLLGRVFMRPVDCPWQAVDRVLNKLPLEVRVRVVDFHAEATSDKQLMGRHLDGRVSAVLGTHTHVPTADGTVFPGGTAFQCDVGMTGPYESILGRRIDRVKETTLTFRPTTFQVAKEDVRLCGAIVDVDPKTGRALGIERLEVTEEEASQWPSWNDNAS